MLTLEQYITSSILQLQSLKVNVVVTYIEYIYIYSI